jgi:hypothetical protein
LNIPFIFFIFLTVHFLVSAATNTDLWTVPSTIEWRITMSCLLLGVVLLAYTIWMTKGFARYIEKEAWYKARDMVAEEKGKVGTDTKVA